MKLLGLDVLVAEVTELKAYQKDLTMAQEGLRASLDEVTEKVDNIEVPDMDDYVLSCGLDDSIYSYLNDNDYVTKSEVEDEVSDAIDNADIDAKVEDAIKSMDKASFGDTEELKAIVLEVIKTLKFKVE